MKTTLFKILKNGIVAVCESFEEAREAERFGASAVCLLRERGLDPLSPNVFPDEEFLTKCVGKLSLPIFVRVRYGHIGEAEFAIELGASGLIEAEKTETSLENSLDPSSFSIPLLSEISEISQIKKEQKNYLLLGKHSSGKISYLIKKLDEWKEKDLGEVFVGGGIGGPADFRLLSDFDFISGFFVGTALFDVEDFEIKSYLKESIDHIKNNKKLDFS